MKHYITILAALFCYGCVTQQPKDEPSPRTSYPVVDSKHSTTSEQVAPKITPSIAPKSSKKTTTVKTVKKTKVIRSKPAQPKKIVLPPKKTVKSNSVQLSTNNAVTPKAKETISTEKHAIISTPLASDNLDMEDSIKADTEQFNSTNQNSSNVDQIITSQNNLESSSEILETESPEIEESIVADIPVPTHDIVIDLEKLPLSFGGTWILDRNHDKISNTTRCLLNSLEKKFDDGYADSKISLQLSADTLLIKTASSIDLSYPDVGLYIDQNKHFPLQKLSGETNIIIRQDAQKITKQLLNGERLTLKLGFWPTWPKKETRSIDFLLSDFNEAYQSFLACEKL